MARDPARLGVFEEAHQLVLDVYTRTRLRPDSEKFGLASRLRRAAVSIPTNIVEGCARPGVRDDLRCLTVATGSAVEIRYLLRLAVDLGFVAEERAAACQERSDKVARTLLSLCETVAAFEG